MRSDFLWGQIHGVHRSALIAYVERAAGNRAEAEDVVQDAWLHLRQAIDRERVRDPGPYLYRIVRNLTIDGRRKAGRRDTCRTKRRLISP